MNPPAGFSLASDYRPQGDQEQAIDKLVRSIQAGNRHQTLLGVTGSGKTFTAANVVAELNRPTLVMSHNKTLAAQLFSEFKQFFPQNAVEYFVSYFDYYQPEAYIPRSDTYIEKDSSINEEIERLRLSAVSSLMTRRDTLVVASVSCIHGLASPEDFLQMLCTLKVGQLITREALLGRLVDMPYERNDVAFTRGQFRVRGDVVEGYLANKEETALRLEDCPAGEAGYIGFRVASVPEPSTAMLMLLGGEGSSVAYSPAQTNPQPPPIAHVAASIVAPVAETLSTR